MYLSIFHLQVLQNVTAKKLWMTGNEEVHTKLRKGVYQTTYLCAGHCASINVMESIDKVKLT